MNAIEVVPFEKDGKQILWFVSENMQIIPLVTICDLYDVEYGYALQILQRNEEKFEGMVVDLPAEAVSSLGCMMQGQLTTGRGKQKIVKCMTLAGYLMWVGMLDYKRYDGEKKQVILSTQRWLVETGQEVLLKKEKPALAPVQMGIGDVFLQCNSIVDKIVEKHNVEPIIATQIALIKTQKITGVDMSDFVKLLPPVPETEVALLTPTEIANRREMRSNREVNKMLEMMGMQEKRKVVSKKGKETMDWFPTEKGKDYCFSFPYVNNGHSGYQLKWKEAIIPIMDEWERKHPDLFSY